ncbi:hypothetical protein DVA80_20860, partial [Acinetobacter baumannii]
VGWVVGWGCCFGVWWGCFGCLGGWGCCVGFGVGVGGFVLVFGGVGLVGVGVFLGCWLGSGSVLVVLCWVLWGCGGFLGWCGFVLVSSFDWI